MSGLIFFNIDTFRKLESTLITSEFQKHILSFHTTNNNTHTHYKNNTKSIQKWIRTWREWNCSDWTTLGKGIINLSPNNGSDDLDTKKRWWCCGPSKLWRGQSSVWNLGFINLCATVLSFPNTNVFWKISTLWQLGQGEKEFPLHSNQDGSPGEQGHPRDCHIVRMRVERHGDSWEATWIWKMG